MTASTTTEPTVVTEEASRGVEFKKLSELTDKERGTVIRLWAAQNGTAVNSQGRIAQSVKDAYVAANGA